MRLFLGQRRQIVVRDVDQRLLRPVVWLVGVRVDGVGDELLPLGQHLDRVLVAQDVHIFVRPNLAERLVAAKHHQRLRLLADPQRCFADVVLDPLHQLVADVLVETVDVDGWGVLGQDADTAVRHAWIA